MKLPAFLSLLLTASLASCTSFAPTYPPPNRQPIAAPQSEIAPPPPSGPSPTRQVYGTAQQAAGAINTGRTLNSVF